MKRTKLFIMGFLICLAGVMLFSTHWQLPVAYAGGNLNVYVLSGGDVASDQAIVSAIMARGHTANLGVATNSWDGSQQDLSNIDVVLLNGNEYFAADMPEDGQTALLTFVAQGGGMVTNAWAGYQFATRGNYQLLETLFPFTYVSDNGFASQTTYAQITGDATLNAGMPLSFTFPLSSFGGTEEEFAKKVAATTYYTTSQFDRPGLVGWSFIDGRVASFSNLLRVTELGNSDLARLLVNTIEWTAEAAPADCNVTANDSAGIRTAVANLSCSIINVPAGSYVVNTVISRPIKIRGAGEGVTIITAEPGRAFKNNAVFGVQDVTIQGGAAGNAAGIYNDEDKLLFLDNVTMRDNIATADGGALYNLFGTVYANNVTFIDNQASNGAGVWTYGPTYLTNSHFENNDASIGGGAIYQEGSTVEIVDSFFLHNAATNRGGMLESFSDEAITIVGSEVRGNSAESGGALYSSNYTPLTITNSKFITNSATGTPRGVGGAVYVSGSGAALPVSISNSEFTSNTATFGGALYFEEDVDATIADTKFEANQSRSVNGVSSDEGGAIYSIDSDLAIADSYFLSNSTETRLGGAIAAWYSTTTIDRTTFAGNESDKGAAIWMVRSTVDIAQSTFAENDATEGLGIIANASGILNIAQSTFSANTGTPTGSVVQSSDGIYDGTPVQFSTTINHTIFNNDLFPSCRIFANHGSMTVSEGHNLFDDNSCPTDGDVNNPTTDQVATDALLGDLDHYEGSQWPVVPLLDGSPALDRGTTNSAACSGLDGRGATRFVAVTPVGACDIGAVEIQAATLQASWFSPWGTFYDWTRDGVTWRTGGGFVKTGRDLRTTELTRPATLSVTTLTDIAQTYSTFNDGRLYWRFCADYDSVTTNANGWQQCAAWGSGSGNGHAVNDLDNGGASINVLNTLSSAAPYFNDVYSGSTVTGQYGGQAVTPQQLAISGTLQTVYEQSAILLIYGNEFLSDALRHNVANVAVNAGDAILQEEIDQLNQALAMFELANETLFIALDHEMGGVAGNYIGTHFTPQMFATYAAASERQVETLIEIAQREWLLSFSPGSSRDAAALEAVVQSLNDAYAVQYLQALAFAKRAEQTGGGNTFLDNGGQQLVDNLDRLLQMAETLRTTDNPLGYDSAYVPTNSFEELRGKLTDVLATAQASEDDAIAELRTFDQNASELFGSTGELAQLRDAIRDELATICGAGNDNADPNLAYTECAIQPNDTSELEIVSQDLRTAHKAAALAWQEAMNVAEFIRIETVTAQAEIAFQQQYGQPTSMDAYDLALAKMDSFVQAGTTAQPAQDPYDPSQPAYWLNLAEGAVSCAIAGASIGQANADRCGDAIFDPLHDAFGTGYGRIEPANEDWSPNNAFAVGVQIDDMQRMREAELSANITGARSSQRVKELLLEQSDLLLAYEIELEEVNRVILERNALLENYQRLRNRLSRIENDVDYSPYDPIQRIIRDSSAENANNDLNRAIHYAYITAKALEYLVPPQSGDDKLPIPYYELFQARRVQHVEDFVEGLDDTLTTLGSQTSFRAPFSLAQEIFGFDDDYINDLLASGSFTPDWDATDWAFPIATCNTTFTNSPVDKVQLRNCLFQERLQRGITTDELITDDPDELKTLLFARFGTSIDLIDPIEAFWYQKLAGVSASGCNGACQGVAVDVLTGQSFGPSDFVQVSLTHNGVNSYRRPSNGTTAEISYFSPGRGVNLPSIIASIYGELDGTTASMQSNINGTGLNKQYGEFDGLSSAVTDWRMKIDITDGALDVAKITDIVLTMEMLGVSQSGRAAADAQLWSEYRFAQIYGEEVSAETQNQIDSMLQDAQAARIQRHSFVPKTTTNAARSSAPNATDLLGGSYNGTFAMSAPVALGIIDFGATLTVTGSSISGHLCDGCTPHADVAVSVSGTFTNTPSTVDAFYVISQPSTQTVSGQIVTRTVEFWGTTARGGDLINGTYRETVDGYLDEQLVIEGDMIAVRPSQTANNSLDPNATPTAVTVVATPAVRTVAPSLLLVAVILTSLTLLPLKPSRF